MAVLISLGLGSNHIGPEGVKAIAEPEALKSGTAVLTTLYLGSSSIDDEGAKAIAVPCPRAQRC